MIFINALTRSVKDFFSSCHVIKNVMNVLYVIHQRIGNNISDGAMFEEFEEQVCVCIASQFFERNDRVLELGCNVGRVTLVLSHLVDPSNIVAIDASPKFVETCRRNLLRNGISGVRLVSKAISNVPLTLRDWDTFVTDSNAPLPQGHEPVETITWPSFRDIYGTFDVLVVDCEGGLFPILQDHPDFLDGIRIIVIENDFQTAEQTKWVDSFFMNKGYQLVYDKPLFFDGCVRKDHFYSIWMLPRN